MKYRVKKFADVEAVTFEDLVEYGRQNGANIVSGVPWSFGFHGYPITHENDDCYLVPTKEGPRLFKRGSGALLVFEAFTLRLVEAEAFRAAFNPVTDTAKLVILESPLGNVLRDNGEWERVHPGSPKTCMAHSLNQGEAPFASHLLYARKGIFGDADKAQREIGMKAGFAWNTAAQEAVVYTDRGISPGMVAGLRAHLARGLPIEFRSLGIPPRHVAEQVSRAMGRDRAEVMLPVVTRDGTLLGSEATCA